MKQLNLYYLGGGGPSPSVPDGKTVTPTDDVTLWLECANIKNTGYTTVAEVIADTGVLTSVLADDNANDYLARSTTFASDITADNLAMTTIGQNNYASNALLSVEDWITALYGSTYCDIVLNVKIPIMSNNTTPSGVCSGSSVYGNGADFYKAVDNSATSSEWDAWISAYNVAGNYWQYRFPYAVRVVYMYISGRKWTGDANGQVRGFILKGSNNGTDFTSITPYIDRSGVGRGVRTYHTIFNNNTYEYYKVSDIPDTIAGIGELQFYGRKDV